MCVSQCGAEAPKPMKIELQKSGMLKLPFGRLLQYHKNVTTQEPGCNEDVLQWVVCEAEKKNTGTVGKTGGVTYIHTYFIHFPHRGFSKRIIIK